MMERSESRETAWRGVAMGLGLILSAVGGAWYGESNMSGEGHVCRCVPAEYARVTELRETTQIAERALTMSERVRDSLNTHLQGRGSGVGSSGTAIAR